LKVKTNPIQEFLTSLRISFLGDTLMHKYDNEKPPLRSELFSLEQMEQYARELAARHSVSQERIPEQLLRRLADNEEILLEVHQLLTESAKENVRITPAGEWLLDNFYLIEEQIYTGKKHLPKGFSKGLPQLEKGPSAGLPRVYDIALELISHSDGRVDANSLSRFVTAYQESSYLKLGELWAIPIMLRLALIENLRRLAGQIAKDRINKNLADYWADQMTETAEKDPKSLILIIADMARYGPPLVSSFVAELTRRLTGKGSALALPLSWIEQRLSERGMTSNELVHLENQKQAADQVSISNSIGSLRFLNTNEWRDFVEKSSVVEQTLLQDPPGIYASMDFRTRDHYRHIVEGLAKKSVHTEQELASMAIALARARTWESESQGKDIHVGFYLIGKGLRQLEKRANIRFGFAEKLKRTAWRIPLMLYAGGSAIIAIIVSAVLIKKAWADGLTNLWLLGLLAFFTLIATSQLAITLINWLATILAKPHLLARMDYSKGIPKAYRTMVVVPTMFGNERDLDGLVEGIEVRFLANRDANLYFALLTDFADAKTESLPGEDTLLQYAKDKIAELNFKYGKGKDEHFFLFHRPRKWNPKDKIWMGYERKRGKLAELNAMLLGSKANNDFSLAAGPTDVLTSFKYVITLDTDTLLPRDAAWKIVGTMAHPLNHPVYSEKKQRVVDGYTILQPRVAVSLPHGESSLYARMHGNDPGIDPYTRAISDVYQDLFQEGSFIGKGIYDVSAFEHALSNRFPENRILSHDLLEGSYARCGLLSDVQLYEEYPSRFDTDMKRRHRWIRGDWQIGSWLWPLVPGPGKRMVKNPISALSRWKIFDNLRRSLVPLSLLMLLFFGWMLSPSPSFWTLIVIAIIVVPSVVSFVWGISRKPDDMRLVQHVMFSLQFTRNHFIQHLLTFSMLGYEAFLNLHAILLTNWRILFTHRKLLQWNPSATTAPGRTRNLFHFYLSMWVAPLVSVGVFTFLTYSSPLNLAIALPVLGLWLLSPALAWRISLPFKTRRFSLNGGQKIFLHKLARKTWAYFEYFVVAGDNWLPPDNYQENPVDRIAHRTSPTNIGMALLANLSAFDFGYVTPGELIERSSLTMHTMQNMERYRGHFYNWYDTQTLQTLHPRYISTVDSGNLAGHLLTLKQGLSSLTSRKIISPNLFEGLRDTVNVLAEKMVKRDLLQSFQKEIELACFVRPALLETTRLSISKLTKLAEEIPKALSTSATSEQQMWADLLLKQCRAAETDLLSLVPWMLQDPCPPVWSDLNPVIFGIPTLLELSKMEIDMLPKINRLYSETSTAEERQWLEDCKKMIVEASRRAKERILLLENLAQQCVELSNMDYDFLFDKSQRLLSVGYNVEEHRRDTSFYDLLASESRLTTFVGISQGKLPQESWFALGRQLTNPGNSPVLLSWSGSMFEYLMPLLIMPTYDNTLLDETYNSTVQKQIEYGHKRNVPWGVSESGYNMVDSSLNYQYRAFGVPGLGLKRGLGDDLVIAPYASVMALMVQPEEACKNLYDLTEDGFEGKFGFYEAVDYTASRLPRGQSNVIVRSYMVHHQGMSLLALEYLLLDQLMQKRFESEAQFRAALLLLQERIPQATEFYAPSVHIADSSPVSGEVQVRVLQTPNTPVPELQLLSNGRYHVMVTNAGGGYSRWKDLAVTRWREDGTADDWGSFCFIRDLDNDDCWSSAHQPVLKQGEHYEVVFSQGRAEFRRLDQNLETHTEIVVSSEDDVEMRRVHITNRSRKKRFIEVTSYAEVVLAHPMADATHQAFSNLFVQTEINSQRHAILCTRRPRSQDEHSPYMFHLMNVDNAETQSIAYETDRAQFIGRGNTIHHPKAMFQSAVLSGSQGSVLDPIVAIQYRIIIDAHETATIDMVFGMADTKEICNGLIEKYQDRPLTDRAFELAWTHSQVVLRQINATETDEQLYARLAGSVIFANATLRADPSIIVKNQRGQSGLWSYAISGDLPIVLLQITDPSNIELVRQLVQAHAYWRLKGLKVDLVIWNEDHGSYRQVLQNEMESLISPGIVTEVRDKPGGIFIRPADQISNEDRILFQTVARIVISDTQGTLEEQINRLNKVKPIIPYFIPTKFYASRIDPFEAPAGLQFFNGTGGFSKDGKEYVILSTPTHSTPAPWINVLANENFGTIISESAQSYTWSGNAHEFRLTPWNNDPVSDLSGEAFYIRDEESGKFWSPARLPHPGKSTYITRHGFGYSVFELWEDGIRSELTVFVDLSESIKFMALKIRNRSGRPRKLSVTGYMEWVLGDLRFKTAMHTRTEVDASSGAILARNPYNAEFQNRVAFFDTDDISRHFTTDRTEFMGRNGTLYNPEAMSKQRLSGKWGAALDACAAIQVMADLDEEEEREIIFRLGAGNDLQDAQRIIKLFRGAMASTASLQKVKQYWDHTLSSVVISTGDTATDILTNGWLNYQTLASRIWGRSGFYQSGGAYGFRDQLQDVLSLLHNEPQYARKQIILSSSRQFPEGDVQHWWHPPVGRGVRTTCSDDFLWLPYVTAKYVQHTGDKTILDEPTHFIEGRMLNPGEESYYDLPLRSEKSATLYEHCLVAIEHGLRYGEHGLPLMGSGDWNDGMDKVGIHGKGESVWLGFFLYDVLMKFSELAFAKNDKIHSEKYIHEAQQLKQSIDDHAWDGEWYRRAYFDDGTPLGSSENTECKIDSIAQSWSILSKGGDPAKSATAMRSAEEQLVRRDLSLIQLFTPPFDHTDHNPGYIKGYVPGVRENGGQYTHAAVWMVMAFAALGDRKRTWDLLKMINPINHGRTAGEIATYKVEPYVIAADVYAVADYPGRGGWTWYTGSAGWMYQLVIEYFLGLKRKGNILRFEPCIPEEWGQVEIRYRYSETFYQIRFVRAPGNSLDTSLTLDGQEQPEPIIYLMNDRETHTAELRLSNTGSKQERALARVEK
jgi:cyclic beta-1,2-glucan synthetase